MELHYHGHGIGQVSRAQYAVALVDRHDNYRWVCEVYGITSRECAARAENIIEAVQHWETLKNQARGVAKVGTDAR